MKIFYVEINNKEHYMESFIEEFFEEWMDSVINDTPLFHNSFGNEFVNQSNQSNQEIEFDEYTSQIQENIISNIYRIRRSLQIENQVAELQNSMFNNLYEILTEHILPNNTQDFEDVKIVLNKDQFNQLNHFSILQESDKLLSNEYQCNVCMEHYKLNDSITELHCKHFFHKDCIEHWLCNEHVTCPICRKDVRETLK
jgi:hypothetical protein